MKTRLKDILFALIAVPAFIAGAYIWLWRGDMVREERELLARSAAMVAVDDFPLARRRIVSRLEEARARLASAQAAAPKPDESASVTGRERAALACMARSGLTVMRVSNCASDGSARLFSVAGTYPAVRRALEAFMRGKEATVRRLEMSKAGTWELEAEL